MFNRKQATPLRIQHKSVLSSVLLIAAISFSAIPGEAQTSSPSNVSVTIAPEAFISVNAPTTALSASSTFADFTGSTSFLYKIRTSPSLGAGNIQLSVTSDFSPNGGPSVASPPTTGDKLAYTCTLSASGTPCSGSQIASNSAQTAVASFGADVHTPAAGATGSVSWSLTNDPSYKPGTYTAVVTFTISAT